MSERWDDLDDAALERRLRGLGSGGGATPWAPRGGRVLAAEVVVDSWAGGLAATRSAAGLTRQLVLQAGPFTVVLDVVTPDAGAVGCVVSGQLIGSDSGAVVQLITPDGREVALAAVDDTGEFRVVVPAGEYDLVVATATADLITPVTIG